MTTRKTMTREQVVAARAAVEAEIVPGGAVVIPSWLGGLRKEKLGYGERLIRLTSGPLSGQIAIVCPSDPDDDGTVEDLVYTKRDWEAEGPASHVIDGDGDLCECRPDGTASTRTVTYREVQS
jgi:hypothetical protein